MRHSEREIRDRRQIIELLDCCHVGRLGTIGADGMPLIKPVNFVFWDNHIYFHTSLKGEKIQDIARDNRVCFEVDMPIAYVPAKGDPCDAGYDYRSIIIKGRAELIADKEEKTAALQRLLAKYQPEGGYGAIPEPKLSITGVVKITVEELSGKERFKTPQ